MNKKLLTISLLLCITLATILSGCSNQKQPDILSDTLFVFDTVVQIQIYDDIDPEVLTHAVKMCNDYEAMFSRTIDTSEISAINHAGGKPTTVSDETIELIEYGLYYSQLSSGAFDITIAPVTDLWNFKEGQIIPDENTIVQALNNVGYEYVAIDGNTVTLTNPNTMLDLGGIAKGYIADQLKKYLKSEGVKHALINLGGNVLTIGNKPDGTNFNVAIQKPFDKTGTPITGVSVNDQSVVSSGIYERYFELNNKIYHHILDPNTGYPYENTLYGVTILSDLSVDGDGLSTTCFALGLEQGMELIESLDCVEAMFITDDMEMHFSSNFPR